MRHILKKQANLDIREEARKAGVWQWQIAEALGISEVWYTRLLRHELPDEKKAEIRKIIAENK
jgi:hypothetical protein